MKRLVVLGAGALRRVTPRSGICIKQLFELSRQRPDNTLPNIPRPPKPHGCV